MDTVEELNGTYFYKGYTQLTPQQLWWLITVDALREHLRICKHTCFSSMHFFRVPGFQPSAGTLPASGYSGIHEAARCYIPSASAR